MRRLISAVFPAVSRSPNPFNPRREDWVGTVAGVIGATAGWAVTCLFIAAFIVTAAFTAVFALAADWELRAHLC
jgi:hypothetical protein